MTTALILILSLVAGQPSLGWTWALYERRSPIVLAEEVPDTPQLRTTLACQPGSNVARVSLYGFQPATGFMRFAAGDASATGETEARSGGLHAALPVSHPAFVHFVATGRLAVTVGDQTRRIDLAGSHLAKLRRFAELCAG